ncbi:MAG: hypothetical protein EOQ80_04720 [Mesorhizobium sp.]|uniref:hypothetical protein n=1 Tax=Mesorhizobium sp. TaxID=1871066 RepID=UPI000FE9F533|nr:hypothetical protein [Mesorhizobium sp.]RWH50278.1 MAG: hypothetical protein EOQ80_04720 [Mesorhizobium sp.]
MRAQINHARRHATFNVSELRRQGYRQIGRGAFSRAFVHPDAPDVVIKVGKRYSPRVGLYDGFPHFAQCILDHEITSKFYPKIYGLQWSQDKQQFWCIMKRYTKTRARKDAYNINATMSTIAGCSKFYASGKPTGRFKRALYPFVDSRFVPDIHTGNVLHDDKGTPIIVDPICIRRGYDNAVYA